jgi:hypothetical protein
MRRALLWAILVGGLLGSPSIAAAQLAPEAVALGSGDLPEGFAPRSTEHTQELGAEFYAVVYQRAGTPEASEGGPWLVGNVVGVGGSTDLDLALAFFLSRFPAAPSGPFVAARLGPPVGEEWTWLRFDATLAGAPAPTVAVGFRVGACVAVVAVAGPESTEEATLSLAQVVEARLVERRADECAPASG